MASEERPYRVVITHPNRDKPVVQATRAAVVLLFLASTALMMLVTVGGWSALQGMKPVDIGFMAVYLTLAFFALRWNRGVLPVGAALAVLLAIFALVAGPAWFNRDKFGYAQPSLEAGLLGLLTLLIVPLQLLLVAFAMRGFKQGWNVELERREGAPTDQAGGPASHGDPAPYPA